MELNDLTQLKNLKEMVDYAAENFGDTNFLEYKIPGGIESKTYKQFKTAADSFSRFLEAKGFQAPHVAVVGPTSFEWIVSYFGTADFGGIVIPLAPSETDEMNCKLMDFADTDILIFDSKHKALCEMAKDILPNIKLYISIDNCAYDDSVMNISDAITGYEGEYNNQPDGDSVCAIVFTSGTTGFPKGVMLTHKNFVYSAASVHISCPTKRMFCCLPIHHCFCFTANITKSMLRGKTVCVNDNLANVIQDIQMYKPDSIVAVPQLIKKIMFTAMNYAKTKPELTMEEAVKEFLGGNVMDILSGGAPLEPDVNELFNSTGVLVLNGYGMSECSPIISNNAIGFFRHGSVGKPIPCMDVKIENGEILVKGPSVMKGYYKNPEATKDAFTADGFLRTGDLGHFDDDGFLYITGRCKNLILLDNGENVSAEMLEDQFGTEPIVQEVICHGENGTICAEMYLNKLYIKENNITDIDKEMIDLLTRVNSRLASYQRISTYALRDIPFERTSSSKIKRGLPIAAKKTIVAPETPSQIHVCNAVKELLMLKEVSVTDNFFALGGNSLTAVELAVSLNVRPQLIYDKPFLNLLAEAIDETEKSEDCDDIDYNSIIEETKLPGETASDFKCALVTGTTGFLGVHILKELTERNIKIYCLVRNKQRFEKQIKYYFNEIDLSNTVLVTGNIESADLGLTAERYKKLADEVDVVFHVAANVHHAGDYSDLERTNVIGTENIIEFSKKANAVLHHTSTVSIHGAATVMQDKRTAIFDEDSFNIGQHYKDNVYIHSKYCAEQAVLRARKDGLRANIYRIGNLTWRTSDGKFQSNSADNGFLSRIHGILKLGLFNDNMDKYPTDLTAVDECAKAYVKLAMSGRVNEIYHMYNPNFLETRKMFELLDMPYRYVSSAETIETVMANSDDRDIHVYMFYMIISGRSSNIEMKNDFTVERLKQTGFAWSVPDRRYLTVSPDETCPKGHCLNFEPYSAKPMRTSGGTMTPIQKLTLGVMRDAKLAENQLITGVDALLKLKAELDKVGVKRPLLITFKHAFENEKIKTFAEGFNEKTVFNSIKSEPTSADMEKAIEAYSNGNCDSIIAIGGGSVLDTAKIVSLCVTNKDKNIDDICKIGSNANDCALLYAVPTTSGTGSEVTIYSVITDEAENKKKPYVNDKYIPLITALDPELTLSVPKASTAYTGIDALSHAVEAYISLFADSFPKDRDKAPDACKRIFENLRTACDEPNDIEARRELQTASYNAGVAFRRIGTGYIHAIAHRIGEFYHLPHGLTIACVFTAVLKAYLPYASAPLAELARHCGFADESTADNEAANRFIEEVDSLIFDVNAVGQIEIDSNDLDEISRRAQEEAKLTGYPRPFSDEKVREIIKEKLL